MHVPQDSIWRGILKTFWFSEWTKKRPMYRYQTNVSCSWTGVKPGNLLYSTGVSVALIWHYALQLTVWVHVYVNPSSWSFLSARAQARRQVGGGGRRLDVRNGQDRRGTSDAAARSNGSLAGTRQPLPAGTAPRRRSRWAAGRDENGSDTNGYYRYYICFHISGRIRIENTDNVNHVG